MIIKNEKGMYEIKNNYNTMEYSLEEVEEMKEKGENLREVVKNYIEEQKENYDKEEYIYSDVLKYGLQSGTIGWLMFYRDTVLFYHLHRKEIDMLVAEELDSYGSDDISELFGGNRWDKRDMLANDMENKNLLTWFGFETMMNEIANENDIDY